MHVRKANIEDVKAMQDIIRAAKVFMRETGNPNQWNHKDYPEALIPQDVENGNGYVIEEDGRTVGTFTFIIGRDPTYDVIEDGSWIDDDKTYGTIHRIASDGSSRGLLEAALDFCFSLIDNIRIDTHDDNKLMQHKVLKNGFSRRGIIYVADGTPRIAYQKILKTEEHK